MILRLDEEHRISMEALQAKYMDAVQQRESSIEGIAQAMADLAAASQAPAATAANVIPIVPVGGVSAASSQAASAKVSTASPASSALVRLDEADQVKCTDCSSCYQDLPELFEKIRIVVDGESREVGHLKVAALASIKPTDELKNRIKRVAANCDAEIIV